MKSTIIEVKYILLGIQYPLSGHKGKSPQTLQLNPSPPHLEGASHPVAFYSPWVSLQHLGHKTHYYVPDQAALGLVKNF